MRTTGRGSQLSSILVTQQKKFHPLWLARTTMLPGWLEELQRRRTNPAAASLARDLVWAWRLFRASRQYGAVLTGSERPALLFALLQRCLRPRPAPHIVIECMWNLPPAGWRRKLRRFQLRLALGAIRRVVVWSGRQVQSYSAAFGMPPETFVFLPFHTTLHGATYQISQQPYVFAGGDSNRDYGPLIEAARGLPWKVVISSRNLAQFRHRLVPGNVEILTAEGARFLQLMAGAGIVAVPLRGGLLHSGGHQTYLNAMAMGKAVVVADDCGAEEYIRQGVTGLVVPPGDPDALRTALLGLIAEPARILALGENARSAVQEYSLERYIQRLFALVEECLEHRRGRPGQIQPRA